MSLIKFLSTLEECPHCGAPATKFVGETDAFNRTQFGIECYNCPALVMLLTNPNEEPTDEDWNRAKLYWNTRIEKE